MISSISKPLPIAICGAGPVGQVLALLLHQSGIPANNIILFDAKTRQQAIQDSRTIALAYGSRQILQAVHAWPVNATAITQIHVSRRAHFGRTLLSASDYQLPALGYVARYADIMQPLENLIEQAQIQIIRPLKVTELQEQDSHVTLNLADGSKIDAACVIQAEGGTFDGQSERIQRRDYQQTAVIAHLNCSAPIANRAFERFTENGPLALLPQDKGYSLVWCTSPAQAEALTALSDAAFLSALQKQFGHRLGNFTGISQRHCFALGLNAEAKATARIVNIGNAAQTLHPVAGQGLNLGLRDAMVLAQHLRGLVTETSFNPCIFKDFIRNRQTDRKTTIGITDGMARIFSSSADGTFRQAGLGLSLGLLDLLATPKKHLADQMMFGWR